MKQVISTHPTRANWGDFCSEPPLDEQENSIIVEMNDAARDDEALQEYLYCECREEFEAMDNRCGFTDDWSDMVEWADLRRRMKRAEIMAFVKWKAMPAPEAVQGEMEL